MSNINRKNHYPIYLPILITVFALLTKMVRFIVNDDLGMMRIAESYATNAHSEHLVFMNLTYGYLLKFLYSVFGNINWFVLLELIIFNIAFIALFYIAYHFQCGMIGISALICAELFLLANFTFTTIAFVTAAAGMLWMLTFVKELKQEYINHIVISTVLITLAFFMRSGGPFYFTVLHLVPIMLFSVLKKRNKISVIALLIVLCTVVNFTAVGINRNYHENLPDSLNYKQFQQYRSAATDGGAYNYTEHSDVLKPAGISRIDYRLMSHWTFADKKVFTGKKMKALADSRGFKDRYNTDIQKIINNFFQMRKLPFLLLALLLLAIITAIFLKKCRWEALCSFAFTIGAIGYLFFRRRALERLTNSIAVCGFILLLYIVIRAYPNFTAGVTQKLKLNTVKSKSVIAIVCALTMLGTYGFNWYQVAYTEAQGKEVSNVVAYTQEHDDVMYLCDSYCFDKYILNRVNENILKPYALRDVKLHGVLGGWNIYSYYYYDVLERIGLSDYSDSVISALLKDDVYYITTKFPADTFVKYFKQHYKLNVAYDVIQEFPEQEITIYNYYIVND